MLKNPLETDRALQNNRWDLIERRKREKRRGW